MSSLARTYNPQKMSIVKGQGTWLYDDKGKAYLDFASGIAVTSLGHGHPVLTTAIQSQAKNLLHVSNLYGVQARQELADRLVQSSFAESVFFCNSGAEAIEACLKFARRYHWYKGDSDKYEIISFAGAFHGRTLATIAASGSPKYLEGFGPKVTGFHQVPFGDLSAAQTLIGPKTAALIVEPVQGEGGVRPNTHDFMRNVRALADSHDLLLILDEVQTGIGRTGRLWAYEHFGIVPDLLASAKGLAGGIPIGAALMTGAVANCLAPGIHGTTFGGNPLAMAAGKTVVDIIDQPEFLAEVRRKGKLLSNMLAKLACSNNRVVAGNRGLGLMQGLQLYDTQSIVKVVETARLEGLLTVPASDQTIRLLPPLTVTDDEIIEALARLQNTIKKV